MYDLNEKEAFIQFLSNCDATTFYRTIEYINMKGFLEGMYGVFAWKKNQNTLLEAMEYANSSYDSVKEYLEDKYGDKID